MEMPTVPPPAEVPLRSLLAYPPGAPAPPWFASSGRATPHLNRMPPGIVVADDLAHPKFLAVQPSRIDVDSHGSQTAPPLERGSG